MVWQGGRVGQMDDKGCERTWLGHVSAGTLPCCCVQLRNLPISAAPLVQKSLQASDSRQAQRQGQHNQASGAGDKQEAGHLRRSVAQRGSRLAIQAAVSGRGHACGGLRWQRMLVGRRRARWQKQHMQAG